MKISKQQLTQIIKEEVEKELNEWDISPVSWAMRGAETVAGLPAHMSRKVRGIKRKVNAIAVAWPSFKPSISKGAKGLAGYARKLGLKKSPLALGHAGVVLINNGGVGHYYDFGRYYSHGAKPGKGVVRGPYRVPTKAKWDKGGDLKNKNQFLAAIKKTGGAKEYAGAGTMKSALIRGVNYSGAKRYANSMKGKNIPYNLLQDFTTGENCSTFVARVLRKGGASSWSAFLRKQLVADPAAIISTLANDPDEEVINV
jgi:hypothetical protein